MLPHDLEFFTPLASTDWCAADEQCFKARSELTHFSLTEEVHLAGVALQNQWICDVGDTPGVREAIVQLGIDIAAEQDEYLIVTGSETFAEYLQFRGGRRSLLETGIAHGYPPSAVFTHVGLTASLDLHTQPVAAAHYFLVGGYSAKFAEQEHGGYGQQWIEIRAAAPMVVTEAEAVFAVTLHDAA